METPNTAWFRGEGGVVMEMDLPLPEAIAQRVQMGAIVRVADQDGGPYIPPDEAEEADEVPAPPTERPADSALKPAWIAWAVACGAEPETALGMTKPDLIDKYGPLTPVQTPVQED